MCGERRQDRALLVGGRSQFGVDAGIMLSMPEPGDFIMSVLEDIEPLMQAAFDAVGGSPPPGSALDQVFLLDGRAVVEDYLAHGECRLAYDHLVYMINEPPLRLDGETARTLIEAGRAISVPDAALQVFSHPESH